MNICPECRASIPAESNFCNRCGHGVAAERARGVKTEPFPRAAAGFEPPHEWGAMATTAAPSAPHPSAAFQTPHAAASAARRGRRLGRWGGMALVALISLGAGVAGTQFYHLNFAPAGQVEIDGEMHPEFVTVGGTKFQYADGAHVFETTPDSDVTRAGLKVGDVIIRVDGVKVRYMEDFNEILGNAPVGKQLDIIYIRDGVRAWTTLTPTTNWDNIHEKTDPEGNPLPVQKANHVK